MVEITWLGHATFQFRLDSGEVILQEPVPIADDDTVESLREKIQAVEHVLLPEACRLALGGKLQLAAGSRRVRIAP